jgi:hypothetical protein
LSHTSRTLVPLEFLFVAILEFELKVLCLLGRHFTTSVTPPGPLIPQTNQKTPQDSTVCCLQETHLIGSDLHRLKVKEWKTENRLQAKVSQKE